MSDENQSVKTGWSSVQVYVLSAICLLIGVTMGYLVRGSSRTESNASVQTSAENPAAGTQVTPSTAQPSPDDMKRMAEKQVAPLLEQLKSNPKDAETLAKVAHYYMVAQQYNDGAAYYEKSAEITPTAEVLTNLANAYFYAGAGDKAIDALNRALKVDPNSANALYNLGVLKWQVQGDSKGAIECWQKLLKTNLDPKRKEQVEKMIAGAKKHSTIPAGTKTDKPAM